MWNRPCGRAGRLTRGTSPAGHIPGSQSLLSLSCPLLCVTGPAPAERSPGLAGVHPGPANGNSEGRRKEKPGVCPSGLLWGPFLATAATRSCPAGGPWPLSPRITTCSPCPSSPQTEVALGSCLSLGCRRAFRLTHLHCSRWFLAAESELPGVGRFPDGNKVHGLGI